MTFSEYLARAMQNANLTQYALAKQVGCTQSLLSSYMRGDKKPAYDTLERLCSALGVTLSGFFSESPPEVRPVVRRLLDAVDTLPDDKVDTLTAAAKAMK